MRAYMQAPTHFLVSRNRCNIEAIVQNNWRSSGPAACLSGRIAEDRANCELIAREVVAIQQLVLMALGEHDVVVRQACKTIGVWQACKTIGVRQACKTIGVRQACKTIGVWQAGRAWQVCNTIGA